MRFLRHPFSTNWSSQHNDYCIVSIEKKPLLIYAKKEREN
jgi:hypothetical protein